MVPASFEKSHGDWATVGVLYLPSFVSKKSLDYECLGRWEVPSLRIYQVPQSTECMGRLGKSLALYY